MESTNGVGNNTILIGTTINSLCSKINLMSHITIAVIEQDLSNLEVTFHLFGPKLLTICFIRPGTKYVQQLQTKLVWSFLGPITSVALLWFC